MDKESIKRLHEKKIAELKRQEQALREEIAKLRLEKEAGNIKNVHQLKMKRHDLARVLTVIRERELHGRMVK